MKFLLKNNNREENFGFSNSDLPILISGQTGSGASYFSLCLAAYFYMQGEKLFFFTAKNRAREEFEAMVESYTKGNVIFSPSGNTCQAIKTLREMKDKEERIIFIKNIEEILTPNLLEVARQDKLVFSGDVEASRLYGEISAMKFNTTIFFSHLSFQHIPLYLKKYEAYFAKKDLAGKIRVIP